jgi:hypothetical protein
MKQFMLVSQTFDTEKVVWPVWASIPYENSDIYLYYNHTINNQLNQLKLQILF